MKASRAYDINFASLSMGSHQLDYSLSKDFLQNYPEAYISDIKAFAVLSLNKMHQCLETSLNIQGTVVGSCDVCTEDVNIEFKTEEFVIFKFVDMQMANIEDELNVLFIDKRESIVNVADILYETIMLSLPIRTLHDLKADGSYSCNPEYLKYLNQVEDVEDIKNNPFRDLKEKFKN